MMTLTDWQMVGSWADWFTAGTAFLALVVATIAGVATWRTNRAQQETLELQRQQFQAASEQLERAQAAKVTYYLGPQGHHRTGASEATASLERSGVGLTVINASDNPVYRLALLEMDPKPRLLHAEPVLFPTGQTPATLATQIEVGWGASSRHLFFEDSSGIGWLREASGALRRATVAEAGSALGLYREGCRSSTEGPRS